MKLDRSWIDTVYTFKGQWDVESRCGLKVARREGRHVFVVTELFTENPGTSVTNFCAQLATLLLVEYQVPPEEFVYVEHCPDRGSRLEHYQETFDRVSLTWDGERFTDPEWQRMTKKEALELVGQDPVGR